MHNPISMIASMMDIPVTYVLYKQNSEVIEVVLETSENFTTETFKYKIVAVSYTHLVKYYY